MGEQQVNQLVIATVASGQAGDVIRTLVEEGFYVTRIDSTSGLLQEATVSLLIGLDRARLPHSAGAASDAVPPVYPLPACPSGGHNGGGAADDD